MDTLSSRELYTKLIDMIGAGQAREVRRFLVDHLSEFPEDVQGQIALGFFDEGLGRVVAEKKLLAEFQEDTAQFMTHMDRLRRMLEDKKKLLELENKVK